MNGHKVLSRGVFVPDKGMRCPNEKCNNRFASHYRSSWSENEKKERVPRYVCGSCESYFIVDDRSFLQLIPPPPT